MELIGLDASWTVRLFTQEYGALLGTANETVDKCWRALGLTATERKRATRECMRIAANASARIWFSRFTQRFRTQKLMAGGEGT